MKVSDEMLAIASALVADNRETIDRVEHTIVSIGCFGCGLGCSDTVGG